VYWDPVVCGVADPDPGSGVFWPLDPGSRMEKNIDPGSGINIPDLIFENFASVFWVNNNFV
jgi:hypothetical protein